MMQCLAIAIGRERVIILGFFVTVQQLLTGITIKTAKTINSLEIVTHITQTYYYK